MELKCNLFSISGQEDVVLGFLESLLCDQAKQQRFTSLITGKYEETTIECNSHLESDQKYLNFNDCWINARSTKSHLKFATLEEAAKWFELSRLEIINLLNTKEEFQFEGEQFKFFSIPKETLSPGKPVFKEQESVQSSKHKKEPQGVLIKNADGSFYNRYESVKEAALMEGCPLSAIYNALSKGKLYKGKIWIYQTGDYEEVKKTIAKIESNQEPYKSTH